MNHLDRPPIVLLAALLFCALLASACSTSGAYRAADRQTWLEMCPPESEKSREITMEGDCSHRVRTYSAEAACLAGNNIGCAWSAYFYRDDDSPITDRDRAIELAAIGCERGEPVACLAQATTLYKGDKYDDGRAYNLLRRTCLEGMGLSCFRMGGWYYDDPEDARERRLAAGFYKKACEFGHPAGCRKYGQVYAEGFGVARNEARAQQLFEKACRMDDRQGCLKAGVDPSNEAKEMFNEYLGVSKEQIAGMYMDACQNGFRHACTYVGRLMKTGELAGRYLNSSDRMTEVFGTGCELGSAESCYYLAKRHLKGWGSLEANTVEATKYAKMACDGGYDGACERYRDYRFRILDKPQADAFAAKCEKGDGEACYLAGRAYNHGANFDRDPQLAMELYKKSCEVGYADGCEWAADFYHQGEDFERDYKRAGQFYRRACEGGADYACYILGKMYIDGRGVEKDEARGLELLVESCERDWKRGCALAGYNLMNGVGTERDDERAFELSREGCQQGHLWACNNMAILIRDGRGVEKDEEWALRIANWTCDKSSASGCYLVGDSHEDGWGAEDKKVDYIAAADRYEASCIGGSGTGCSALADLYREGKGVEKAPEKALGLYGRGCELENGWACWWAGNMLGEGLGVEVDQERSFSYMKKGCEYGDEDACGALGYDYEKGTGVAQNFELARKAYKRGCDIKPDEHWVCANLASVHLHERGGPLDRELALSKARRACAGDFGRGCQILGLLYARDDDEKSRAHARTAFEKACRLDHSSGCLSLGRAFAEGKYGVSPDVGKAADHFQRACMLGNSEACREGREFLTGDQWPPKHAERLLDFDAAGCGKNNTWMCTNAADALRFGYGVEVDVKRADKLLGRAIDIHKAGCSESVGNCKGAAHRIAHGRGLDTNYRGARNFLNTQCAAGNQYACIQIERERIAGEFYERNAQAGAEALAKMCGNFDLEESVREEACDWLFLSVDFFGLEVDIAPLAAAAMPACKSGDGWVCVITIEHHALEREEANAAQLAEAMDALFADSCEGTNDRACAVDFGHNILLVAPKLTEKYKIFQWATEQCEEGSEHACFLEGTMLHRGYQAEANLEAAAAAFEKACPEPGDSTGGYCARRRAMDLWREANHTRERAETRCESGDSEACLIAGILTEHRTTSPAKLSVADAFYRASCTLENKVGCTLEIQTETRDEPASPNRFGLKHWAKKCALRGGEACYDSARSTGAHNWPAAVEMMQRACSEGVAKACRFLVENGERPRESAASNAD